MDRKTEVILKQFAEYYDRTLEEETFEELLGQHWYGLGLLTGSPRLNPFGLAHVSETGYGTLTVSGERALLSDHSNMVVRVAARVALGEEAVWPDADSGQRILDLWCAQYKPVKLYDGDQFPETEPVTHLWTIGWNHDDETDVLVYLNQPAPHEYTYGWILTKEPYEAKSIDYLELTVTRVCAYCQGALASDSCAGDHWGDIIESRTLNITFGL
jgi:hypothetical protein